MFDFRKGTHLLQVTEEKILSDLGKIGVREGDSLAVTLSLKSIGHVKGGPESFIDALMKAIGDDGTVMMNAFTRPDKRGNVPLSKISESDHVFDYTMTPTYTGLVPETFRKRKDAIRSRHPVTSVTAVGRFARYLTEDHDELSRLFEPYSRLARIGGKYLCIGLENNWLVAIRHEAQQLAGLFDVVPIFRATKYKDRENKIRVYVYNVPPCARKISTIVPVLHQKGILRFGKIGMATAMIANSQNLIDTLAELLKEKPSLNLCNKIYCLWCREAERRLDLFRTIEDLQVFQKSRLLIKAIALINGFRLRRLQGESKS